MQAAYLTRDLGFSVFPLHKKLPAVKRWRHLQGRRPTDRDITKMFERAPWVDGIAAVTGQVSLGLCVRDFDTSDGYLAWARGHEEIARRLPTVKTGRGFHVYIRLPKGYGEVYKSWKTGLLKGELLGTPSRYIVLPPSRHPSGTHYRWLWNEPFTFGDLPVLTPEDVGWLEEAQEQDKEPTTSRPDHPNTSICSNRNG